MFTGIVQTKATVLSALYENNFLKLTLGLDKRFIENLQKGASVAINGTCLTAVDFAETDNNQACIDFDVIDETLRVTNLSHLKQSDSLNLERSLKVGDEIGGHMVSGHIHCQALIIRIEKSQSNCKITFECSPQWMKYILPKGFITINGISLTVGAVSENTFNVHLIPETLSITNLGEALEQHCVNIELDQQTITIVDTIERMQLSLAT